MSHLSDLPVAVIGAGPVGLAAAAHLIARGDPVRLYEASDAPAGHVRSWGHVRLFSPWRYNIDEAAAALLGKHGWRQPPPDTLPTGHDLYAAYLSPLAKTPEISAVLETRIRVRSISRRGIDKVVTKDRDKSPFAIGVESPDRSIRLDLARAVIDASGTWQTQNPMGAGGVPAINELRFQDQIAYGIPDILGAARSSYAGQRVLVVGGGHSAANVLLDLARLADHDAALCITWAVRSPNLARVLGGGAVDQLPARGKLGSDLKRLVDSRRLVTALGFSTERVDQGAEGLVVTGHAAQGRETLGPFDRIIVATGQRPDLAITRELRLDLDPWLESPRALGPLIDPNVHSCGTVPPHGHRELAHAEPGYYIAGIKSYGRAPTFLMATGYEQVRSIVAQIAGDHAAADDVRLVLPETGVCSVDLAAAASAGEACCSGPAPASAEACCADDEPAKAGGATGCGCDERAPPPEPLAARTACCGVRP
jgi:thioredoxin reductase